MHALYQLADVLVAQESDCHPQQYTTLSKKRS